MSAGGEAAAQSTISLCGRSADTGVRCSDRWGDLRTNYGFGLIRHRLSPLNKLMRISFLAPLGFALWFTSVSPLLGAEPIRLQSGPASTPLLELFSSEGCSSCPPAETWLSRLKNDPRLWKDFVPVAFHVDYWDYLGWKDPFATKAHSERQRAYAGQWRSESVYTPGFVLNGKEWRGWEHRDAPTGASTKSVGVLTAVSEDGREWTLQFRPTTGSTASSYEFHAALLGSEIKSSVKAGENRGRVLEHDFAVLIDAKVAAKKDGQTFQGTVTFDSKPLASPHRLALAAWVTTTTSLQPVQSVGGWLPKSDTRRERSADAPPSRRRG